MKRKDFYVLIGAALVTFAVSSPAASQPDSQEYRPGQLKEHPFNPKGAYTEWRRIGRLRKTVKECPSVPGWNVEPLLKKRPGAGQSDHARKKRGLDRYCVYTTAISPPPPFPRPWKLKAAERDRMALAASGTLDEMVAPTLAGEFLEQAGADPSMQLQAGVAPTVRLTFIDSQPTGRDAPPAAGSRHGYTLMQLASQLVCTPSNRCAATIASRRALNYHRHQPLEAAPADEGGHVGTISELADAITDEIDDWVDAGRPGHLILNISLGWDDEDDLIPSEDKPEVKAVYDALKYAADEHVLVIAASGNRRGGPSHSQWPLLPAAWEARPYWPLGTELIYAVGGIDWQGLPLPNSRQGGFSRRAAYGDHAVASTTLQNEPHPPIYTGTSVSAAIVSSAAAMIWHLRPNLGPEAVMGLINDSGEPLGVDADFYPWRQTSTWPVPEARRISVCKAVEHACSGVSCPALVAPLSCAPWDKQPASLYALFPNASVIPTAFPSTYVPPSPCHPLTQMNTENGVTVDYPCPTDQFCSVTGQRWTFPQPPDDPCPGCLLFPPPPHDPVMGGDDDGDGGESSALDEMSSSGSQYYNLRIAITGNWQGSLPPGAYLQSATLDIDRFENGQISKRMTYPIPFDQGMPTPEMTGLGDGDSLLGCRAQINFVVHMPDGSSASLQNPVIVDP